MSRSFLGFAVVGVAAAFVNVISRILLNVVLPYELAVAIAFLIALTTAFVLNREYVFGKGEKPIGTQYLAFATVNFIALALVWTVSVMLARVVFPAVGMTFYPELIAHVIGVASPFVFSFLAYKHYIFAGAAGRFPSDRKST